MQTGFSRLIQRDGRSEGTEGLRGYLQSVMLWAHLAGIASKHCCSLAASADDKDPAVSESGSAVMHDRDAWVRLALSSPNIALCPFPSKAETVDHI